MLTWLDSLRVDPLPVLLASEDEALRYFVRRDLADEPVGSIELLWTLPAVRRLLAGQCGDGSWPRMDMGRSPAINAGLIETWKRFRCMVGSYGMTRTHPQAARAAEFIFSCQTAAGDFRGFLANQYAPYYTGALLGLLLQAGYAGDSRVEAGMRWLLAMRQDDGGWTIPLLTHAFDRATQYLLTSQWAEPVEPDRARPFSHNWTGMVLRAFAEHPTYRQSPDAHLAGELLASRFFQPDAYGSYHAAGYWLRFDYPFWWNNLVAALDSLSKLGFTLEHPQIQLGVDWLITHQQADGLWRPSYMQESDKDVPAGKGVEKRRWISLAICRVLKRLSAPRVAV